MARKAIAIGTVHKMPADLRKALIAGLGAPTVKY